jgi:hypothetical protein
MVTTNAKIHTFHPLQLTFLHHDISLVGDEFIWFFVPVVNNGSILQLYLLHCGRKIFVREKCPSLMFPIQKDFGRKIGLDGGIKSRRPLSPEDTLKASPPLVLHSSFCQQLLHQHRYVLPQP